MVQIVAIEANFDWITAQAYEYRSNHVYPYLEQRGYTIDFYTQALAERILVSDAVTQPDVCYITGVGHGRIDCFTGYCYQNIFRQNDYEQQEVKGKIIHLLSCYTAKKLGADFIRNGAIAFFGYLQEFVVVVGTETVFFECDAEIDRAWANGATIEEIHQRTTTLFEQRAEEYLENEDERTYQFLILNSRNLCSPFKNKRWGKLDATF